MAKKKQSGFKDVPARVNVDELEKDVLQFWEKDQTFKKSLESRKGKPLFTFYDGPPYATGKPHYGHVLQSSIKDAVLRYKTMRGYYVPRRVGWDTHGLPVEVFVEKELGFKNRRDVEAYGIEKFNQKCRETVFRYIDLWVDTLKRLGRWADYEHGYATLDRDYMESEWWVFKQLWDKDLVYKDFRSTPYCTRCGTPLSNYEAGEGYKDKTDTAVYIKLQIQSSKSKVQKKPTYLLVWTTTPWTLPANVAVAYNSNIEYVVAELSGERYILAKNRVQAALGDEAKIVQDWNLKDFADVKYEPMYPDVGPSLKVDMRQAFRLVEGEHVTDQDGTGLVHMAPAFGLEDQMVGKANDLPMLRTIDGAGLFKSEVPEWGGIHLAKANALIVEDLQKRGILFKEEQYTHSYPHCWRCDTPLIYYALDTWFVKVTAIKDRMTKANEQINWIPEHIKEGRFGKGIASAPDWAVSRNRFWSVPVPIWECDKCEHRECVGGLEDLEKFSGVEAEKLPDIHRPYVDDVTWTHEGCGGTMKRIPEVLDVWFDSGSMPYATHAGFPADFIAESIEMTRAWFYFLHVLAVALKNEPAYKNVIGSGIIFGADGNKLSKKLKNYPEIEPTIEKYGADTVRMFFLASTFGEPYVFAEKELQELYRNFTMRLWNVYSFFIQYANTQNWTKKKPQSPNPKAQTILDKWVLARLKQLEHEVISASDAYRMDNAARMFVPFVDDLSNWYVRRSRDRFQPKGEMDQVAFQTLYTVLLRLSKLLSPFMPFLTEEVYRNLAGGESVHLQGLEKAEEITADEQKLLDDMNRARVIVSIGLALRAKAGIKVRQPLSEMVVQGEAISDEITQIVQDEVNVKLVRFTKELEVEGEGYEQTSEESGETRVALQVALTPELKLEGMARDIIRQGQVLRKKAGYQLNDRIDLVYVSGGENSTQAFRDHKDEILRALQADNVTDSADQEDEGLVITLGEEKTHLGVKKTGK